MKRFGKVVIFAIFLGVSGWGLNQALAQPEEVAIEKAAVYYRQARPFSWYYPYNYQFYYPRRGYNHCRWIYTNGAYVYTCS